MSAVNAAEVLARLIKKGMPHEDAIDSFEALGIQVIPFAFAEAAASARFITSATIAQGLSLGDRACLATAQLRGAKAVTSDRAWRVPDLGVEIEFLR
jgi:ribonuclease VapC